MGLDLSRDTAEDYGFESRRRCFFSFFLLLFFFFHPYIKNATYSFLSRSRTFKKIPKKINKQLSKGGDNNLGFTSSFLLYSIGGHNNTAVKITNTYSDD